MHPLLPFWSLDHPPTPEERLRTIAFLEKEVRETGEAELTRLGEFIGEGDFVIDVGSNIGVYALALSNLGADVAAFEPNPELAQMLEWMGFPRVTVNPIALSDEDGTAALHLPADQPDMASLRQDDPPEGASVSVRSRRLDSMNMPAPSFVKIDVEGYEERVLAGAITVISTHRPTLLIEVEERHNRGGLSRITRSLSGLGYRSLFLREGTWCPTSDFDPDRDQDVRHLEATGPWVRRPLKYVNNFLFVPA